MARHYKYSDAQLNAISRSKTFEVNGSNAIAIYDVSDILEFCKI